MSKQNVMGTWMEFLRSLGWPVDVRKHAGWTGHTGTSWKIQHTEEEGECMGTSWKYESLRSKYIGMGTN